MNKLIWEGKEYEIIQELENEWYLIRHNDSIRGLPGTFTSTQHQAVGINGKWYAYREIKDTGIPDTLSHE